MKCTASSQCVLLCRWCAANINKLLTSIGCHKASESSVEEHIISVQARAMEILKAKLLVVQQEQQAKEIAEIRGDMVKAEWGQQIRNYVFHPYKLVKDVRTGAETSDVAGVMDGDLEQFTQAYLRHKGSE